MSFFFIFTLMEVFISTGFQFSTIGNKVIVLVIYLINLLYVAYGVFTISA